MNYNDIDDGDDNKNNNSENDDDDVVDDDDDKYLHNMSMINLNNQQIPHHFHLRWDIFQNECQTMTEYAERDLRE